MRLLHIDFLERSRIAASIQTAPPRAVALPPRILACSATYIHSRMAYWKLTSLLFSINLTSPLFESEMECFNLSTRSTDFSRGSQFLSVFLTVLLCKNPAWVYTYLSFLRTDNRRMKSLDVCDCSCQILTQFFYFHKTLHHTSITENHPLRHNF